MDEKKIEIRKIVLNIEGKEISLSVDSAKRLMGALKELFPEPTVNYPIIIDRYDYPYRKIYPMWEVTCDNKTNIGSASYSVK